MVVWAGTTAPTAAPIGAPITTPTRAPIPGSAFHDQADQGVLAAPGAGTGRDADHIFAFYRDVGTFLLQRDYLVSDADKFSVVVFHAGLDHNNSLANPQTTQVRP